MSLILSALFKSAQLLRLLLPPSPLPLPSFSPSPPSSQSSPFLRFLPVKSNPMPDEMFGTRPARSEEEK
eukprot:763342-Hanusia_phi.AAC.2